MKNLATHIHHTRRLLWAGTPLEYYLGPKDVEVRIVSRGARLAIVQTSRGKRYPVPFEKLTQI